MNEVTMRELRSHAADVLTRVERGESVLVTRDDVPVGELHPIPRRPLHVTSLLARWRHVPQIDATRFRADVDVVQDPTRSVYRRCQVSVSPW